MSIDRVLDERNWLIDLVSESTDVTDSGFDFTENCGEFVYELRGGRFEVTVRELEP